MDKKNFNPVLFLMSLGAGGISIAFWVLLNFTIEHGKGLIKNSQVPDTLPYLGIELASIFFAILHFVTLGIYLWKFWSWRIDNKEGFDKFLKNPLVHNSVMAFYLTLSMSMNVVFVVGNYFLGFIQGNFQSLMLYGLIGWGLLYFFAMKRSMQLLKIEFMTEFDTSKMHFGVLLHPFALVMISVTGFGISGFAHEFWIASTAFFFAMASWLLAVILGVVRLITVFQNHAREGMPARELLPSTLILVPVFMLAWLSFVRMGHYLAHQVGAEIDPYFYAVVTVVPFVFSLWYLVFGTFLIRDYFKKFSNYHVTQWGFICPLVAFVVIGFQANWYWLAVSGLLVGALFVVLLFTVLLYLYLLIAHIRSVRV